MFRIHFWKSELRCFHMTNDFFGVLRRSLCECFGACRVELHDGSWVFARVSVGFFAVTVREIR